MIRLCVVCAFLMALPWAGAGAQPSLEKDTVKTPLGDLEITFIGHGSLMFRVAGTTLHVDPFGRLTDYGNLPKADVVLITHQHGDHLDPKALEKVRTDSSIVILTRACAGQVSGGTVMNNGEVRTVGDIKVEAVPAYNLVHKRENGQVFHPKGEGNGYVLTFGNVKVYVAGDTENTPEMKSLKGIDIAFLPMNLPYTMTPGMVADAVKSFRPKVLYPYHYGETDVATLTNLLKDEQGIEVRIRRMP